MARPGIGSFGPVQLLSKSIADGKVSRCSFFFFFVSYYKLSIKEYLRILIFLFCSVKSHTIERFPSIPDAAKRR